MYEGAEQAHSDPEPPNHRIGAIDVIHLAAQPNPKETAELVLEKDNAVERPHIAQPINMRDQA